MRIFRPVVVFAAVVAAAVTLVAEAQACVCIDAPLSERLDDADAAFVGRIVDQRTRDTRGAAQRVLTVEVDQRVKGNVDSTIVVHSPAGSDCDLLGVRNEPVGLLLTRAPDGTWLGTACSVVAPGQLVAEGGEPRGGVIKVGIGILILGLVLLWALRRLRRGARPELPGAPEP